MIKKLFAIAILSTKNYLMLWKEYQRINLPVKTVNKRILWNIFEWITRFFYKLNKVSLSKKSIEHFSTSSNYQINWKKDCDERLSNNWIAISSLNVDLKIISKAFASRLKAELSSIISLERTAYIEKRFKGQGERLISDLLSVTNNFKIKNL